MGRTSGGGGRLVRSSSGASILQPTYSQGITASRTKAEPAMTMSSDDSAASDLLRSTASKGPCSL